MRLLVIMDSHNQPGEHWLVIFLADQNGLEFLNMYGQKKE